MQNYGSVDKKIPPIINFIWVGGPIPKEYLISINQIAALAKKSGFEVNIWVDKESNIWSTAKKHDLPIAPVVELKTLLELSQLMRDEAFFQQKLSVLFPEEKFTQSNQTLQQALETIINREMVGSSNLAAAADVIRYIFLLIKGGYYIDADTIFHDIHRTSGLIPNVTKHGILISGDIQREVNNDMLAVIPNHAVIKDILFTLIKKYHVLDKPLSQHDKPTYTPDLMDKKREKKEYSPKNLHLPNRFSLTIKTSGPGLLIQAVDKFVQEQKITTSSDLEFPTVNEYHPDHDRYGDKHKVVGNVIAESQSAGSWLGSNKLEKVFAIIYNNFKNIKQLYDAQFMDRAFDTIHDNLEQVFAKKIEKPKWQDFKFFSTTKDSKLEFFSKNYSENTESRIRRIVRNDITPFLEKVFVDNLQGKEIKTYLKELSENKETRKFEWLVFTTLHDIYVNFPVDLAIDRIGDPACNKKITPLISAIRDFNMHTGQFFEEPNQPSRLMPGK